MQTNAKRTTTRPGYLLDTHKILVQELYSILDRAATEYDLDRDVVDDFTQYIKGWAQEREQPER